MIHWPLSGVCPRALVSFVLITASSIKCRGFWHPHVLSWHTEYELYQPLTFLTNQDLMYPTYPESSCPLDADSKLLLLIASLLLIAFTTS